MKSKTTVEVRYVVGRVLIGPKKVRVSMPERVREGVAPDHRELDVATQTCEGPEVTFSDVGARRWFPLHWALIRDKS